MSSIRNPYGKGGVPRSAEALRALGMDVEQNLSLTKGPCLPAGREPEGVLDEIVLSAEERERVERNEAWTFEQLVDWVARISDDEIDPLEFARESFRLHADGTIEYISGDEFFLSWSNIDRLPPYLHVQGAIHLDSNPIKEIPVGLHTEIADFSDTEVKEIPEGIRVESLDVGGTHVRTLPEDLGDLRVIRCRNDQMDLIRSARKRRVNLSISDAL